MEGADGAEAVPDAVNHDVAAGVEAAGVGGGCLGGCGVPDTKCPVVGAVRDVLGDGVGALGGEGIAGVVLGGEAAGAERDGVSAEELAPAEELEGVGVLGDDEVVGGGEVVVRAAGGDGDVGGDEGAEGQEGCAHGVSGHGPIVGGFEFCRMQESTSFCDGSERVRTSAAVSGIVCK